MPEVTTNRSASEQFAEKLLKPDGFWRLLDDTVFQFNDLYRRFWRNGGDSIGRSAGRDGPKDAFVVPAMFDKQSRTFNWIALADPVLDSGSGTHESRVERLTKIVEGLSENFSMGSNDSGHLEWASFARLFEDSPHCGSALSHVTNEISQFRRDAEVYSSALSCSDERIIRLNHSLSILYSSYSHPRKHSLEGCFLTALEKFGHKSPHLVGKPIFGRLEDGKLELESWMDAREIRPADWKYQTWNGREEETIKLPHFPDVNFPKYRIDLAELVVDYFLTPLFTSWELNFNGKTARFDQVLKDHSFLVLVPIYDTWIGSSGFGGLQAVLLVFLVPPCDGEEPSSLIGKMGWEETYKTKVLPGCEILAQGLSTIAIRRAIATPISAPYDLVSHFLKILAEVQDWDEAVVFNGKTPAYRFKRNTDPPSEGLRRVRIPWEMDTDLTSAGSIAGPREQSGGLVSHGNEFYMWWTCKNAPAKEAAKAHYDLWSDYFLPELTDEERGVFQETSIRFKFTKASRIPPSDDRKSRSYLVEAYLRQQLELMRALIPKVRARRAALRNAVSAIMGRNMSHNIGSHVLARYASYVAPADDLNRLNPRADFLSYLQRRMDFLAEVSTSNKAYWTQPLSLKQQLNRLNYDKQLEIFRDVRGIEGLFPPLLRFITGKDQLPATVCIDEDTDIDSIVFSCPGGEVGIHALYVILENIIRNSARHNGKSKNNQEDISDDQVRIVVSAQTKHGDGLIELRIWDKHTALQADGSMLRQSDRPCASSAYWTYTGGTELKRRWEALTTDRLGKKEFQAIPDRINYIIQHERILESDGTPEPNYWGIREMQICAQYLRQLQLSDLEDIRYADHEAAFRDASDKIPLIRAECAAYEEDGIKNYCLAYVIYLAQANLCATVRATAEGEPTQWRILSPGFAEFVLGNEDLVASKRAKQGTELARGLENLRGFSFVVYDDDVKDWIKENLDQLPIRCIPHSAIKNTIEPLMPRDNEDPLAAVESFHKAYADSVGQLPKGHQMAGFAIADDSLGAAASKLGNKDGVWSNPIACSKNESWMTWARSYGEGALHAAFWIDHISEGAPDVLEDLISRFNQRNPQKPVECLAWESCFFGLPATNSLNGLERDQGWELLAACLPRVVVLDERVQAQALSKFRDIALTKYWSGMRVEVPPRKSCDLDKPEMKSCRNWLDTLSKPVEFLIVHLTLLERLRDEKRLPNVMAAINALTEDNDFLAHAIVVVVTGRGVATFGRSLSEPTDLESKSSPRYLPVSAFLEYLVRQPSKLGLMRVLWSASRPKGK